MLQKLGIATLALHQADGLAHAENADHAASQIGRSLHVVLCTGADFTEENVFRGSSTQSALDAVEQLRSSREELILLGKPNLSEEVSVPTCIRRDRTAFSWSGCGRALQPACQARHLNGRLRKSIATHSSVKHLQDE